MNEADWQRARDLWNTPEFAHAQRQRKKVEALFAELKGRIGDAHRLGADPNLTRSEAQSAR
jgi:hypothetical protein